MSIEPSPISAPRSQTVQRLAQQGGFTLLGIAPASPSEHEQDLRDWLASGKQGEMAYLAQHLKERVDPAVLLPGAKSIICVADAYPHDRPDQAGESTPAAGRIARYAWRQDYHKHIKKRLHALADALREVWPEHDYRTTVDTAPVLEREHAQRAGLGWVGKHTLLIHPKLGSWFLLGEIITTLPLQTASDDDTPIMTDHCGQCTRCIQACPTQAITPYSVDASRCVSYLTLEHRGRIDPAFHQGIGQWIAGCDICQEVCPFNQHPCDEVAAQAELDTQLPLLEVMNWDAPKRQAALQRSALKRIKLHQFKRNAIIAAGNVVRQQPNGQEANALLACIKRLAMDASEGELVQQTARDVLAVLAQAGSEFL